jgi:hypothetical protein
MPAQGPYQEGGEDRSLTAGLAPAQKYQFTRGPDQAEACNVHYRHYTLETPDSLGLSSLQRIHEAWAIRRPSLTVQVFTRAEGAAQLDRVAEFVWLVDERLHPPTRGAARQR